MNARPRSVRAPTGRPLLALAGLVTCWVAARIAVSELPAPFAGAESMGARLLEQASVSTPFTAKRGMALRRSAGAGRHGIPLARITLSKAISSPRQAPQIALTTFGAAARPPSSLESNSFLVAPEAAVTRSSPPAAGAQPVLQGPATARRWSADLWLALREGGFVRFGGGSAAPVYGASQAGAVLRYQLDAASRHAPIAYARMVHAIESPEGDLAVGLAGRVTRSVPLTAHVETRISRRGAKAAVRPAAFLTTGIDDMRLPFGFHARGYAQAGYVAGPDATAFVDGTVAAERRLTSDENFALSAGAGLWGGAQRGASRLDVGPSASLRLPLSEGSARLTIDYRLRVAGEAAPASGAAVTLSAGF